jgi:hypothetical protein
MTHLECHVLFSFGRALNEHASKDAARAGRKKATLFSGERPQQGLPGQALLTYCYF